MLSEGNRRQWDVFLPPKENVSDDNSAIRVTLWIFSHSTNSQPHTHSSHATGETSFCPQQTHLHGVDHGGHRLLGDVVQTVLVRGHYHPPFELAPSGKHHGVGAKFQVIVILGVLCHKLLGSREGILRLESMIKFLTNRRKLFLSLWFSWFGCRPPGPGQRSSTLWCGHQNLTPRENSQEEIVVRMDIVLREKSMSFKVKLFFADLLFEPQLQVGPVSAEAGTALRTTGVASFPSLPYRLPRPGRTLFPLVLGADPLRYLRTGLDLETGAAKR